MSAFTAADLSVYLYTSVCLSGCASVCCSVDEDNSWCCAADE